MDMVQQNEIPVKFELYTASDRDKYLVRSRPEILFILRTLMQKNALVTAYVNHGNHFILTSVLELDPDANEMILDYGANESLNRQALKAEKLVLITSQDRIKIQFMLNSISKTQHANRPAFSAPIPDQILRLQRREYYRITSPQVNPLKCVIPVNDGEHEDVVEVGILDISCGGMAVIDHRQLIDFIPDTSYDGCRIELPDIGTVVATLQVRNTFEVTLKNGLTCWRSGCQFVGLPEQMRTLIQRYITRLERERNARITGLT